jgi:hypothetical protein
MKPLHDVLSAVLGNDELNRHGLAAFTRIAGFAKFLALRSWGFAALHPRLYAIGRSAGFG